MPRRQKSGRPGSRSAPLFAEVWGGEREEPTPAGSAPLPGCWLVVRYAPTALFSLKTSTATSSVGKTLMVPTPYAVKMALVDAGFRAGLVEPACAALVRALARIEVRIAPPESAVVTNTFVKIRQESRDRDPLRPYGPSIAYRELVHHRGVWRWAFDLTTRDGWLADRITHLAPLVNYVGKRGSFIQYLGKEWVDELSTEYTVAVQQLAGSRMPARWHPAKLDDFGPEASLEVLSSFTDAKPNVPAHRRYVDTLVPLGLVSTGPGFAEYRAE